jgi:hypothetical protein
MSQGADGPEYFVAIDKSLGSVKEPRVVAHELGHWVDEMASNISTDGLSTELKAVYNELNNAQSRGPKVGPQHVGYKGEAASREYMAEAIRAYMTDPNYLKTVAPKTAARIREYANGNPRINRVIQFNSSSPGLVIGADGAVRDENGNQIY